MEEFIIKIDLEADNTRRQLVLAEALLRREGLAPAQRIIATLRSSLPASPMTVQGWGHALDLEELAVDLAAKQGRLIANPPWERLFQKVDGVHVIARLRYLSSMLGTKGFAVTHPELMHRVQDGTLRLADPEFLARAPFAAIYHGLIRLQLGHYEQQDASQLLA
ncbi:MAG: hypothetical protein U0176_09190 [Bacteroidia bacterium]